jgi:hypothetical protein
MCAMLWQLDREKVGLNLGNDAHVELHLYRVGQYVAKNLPLLRARRRE